MKQIKKTHRMFAMALAVIMALGLVIVTPNIALANAPTLELAVVTPAADIVVGSPITIEVRIGNNPGFSMVDYRLEFDTAVVENFTRAVGTVGTAGLAGGFGFSNAVANGRHTRLVNDEMTGQEGDGSISVYTFTVATPGTVSFTLVNDYAYDADVAHIDFNLVGENTVITVGELALPAPVPPVGVEIVTETVFGNLNAIYVRVTNNQPGTLLPATANVMVVTSAPGPARPIMTIPVELGQSLAYGASHTIPVGVALESGTAMGVVFGTAPANVAITPDWFELGGNTLGVNTRTIGN